MNIIIELIEEVEVLINLIKVFSGNYYFDDLFKLGAIFSDFSGDFNNMIKVCS